MIRVWSDRKSAGVLDRLGSKGSTYAYDPAASADRAVSVTMPVRVKSWDTEFGLAPIFEMNLPEGALREYLKRRFAKATGRFDDFDLLSIVGRSQIGRIRYSALNETLSEEVPFQSIDQILRARRDGELFDYLLEQFAMHSGLSGIQPKVMIRARAGKASDPQHWQSPSVLSATHIVKLWEAGEYPELAANEYFCLKVAQQAGLSVSDFRLSDDGGALVIERFDLVDDRYLGFEDFCVLNALHTGDKYSGGYERRIFRRLREFIAPADFAAASESLFRLFVLNCAIRNGDAHLKNFGIIYESVDGPARLAPVYDLITTWPYIPNDPMALTLDGSSNWPSAKKLMQLGQTRADLGTSRIEEIFEATADAMATVAPGLGEYFRDSELEVGARMSDAWETGIRDSLGLTRGQKPVAKRGQREEPHKASSDARVLELLRRRGGRLTATQAEIAKELDLPASTISAAIKRLVDRGMIERSARSLSLPSKGSDRG